MIKNLFDNWKTTSTGLVLIGGTVVHIVYNHKSLDENAWTVTLSTICGGVGLIATAYESSSNKQVKELNNKVEATTQAVISGDTTVITKQNEKTTN